VERAQTGAGQAIVRWYEDSTWLSDELSGTRGALTTTEAAAMAKCGTTLIGFDQLTPEDPRLSAIVWSWAKNEPAKPTGVAQCAASSADTRFHDEPCAAPHAFVCSTNPDTWTVTAATGPWSNGAAACAAASPGSTFSVPRNGWENTLVRNAADGRTVWLAYSDRSGTGNWSD
jgi:hypothetical protein